jgi:phosphate transport system substrate-binding protein
MRLPIRTAAGLAALSLLAAACGDGDAGDPTAAQNDPTPAAVESDTADTDDEAGPSAGPAGSLDGAGASFPAPLFEDWIFTYQGEINPDASINYQSIGSGGGIEQFLAQTVDFGSSERYLDDETLAEAAEERGCEAIQFPVVYGAVTLAFHDEELDDLILDAEAIAGIFQREITTYDDPAIAELNPDRDLPDTDIIPVHRSDGSGTTSVFTTYLEDAADGWELGSGTEVQWPSGTLGGQGNEGVTAQVEQNPGGVGYVNQAYALENDLPTARVVNADGNPVKATLEATSEAVETIEVPDDFQFDILGVGGEGFPIAGTNWIFAWECGYDDETAELLKHFWNWALSDEADELALELQYAPLGDGLKDRVRDAIERINSAE